MMKYLYFTFLLLFSAKGFSQTNIRTFHPETDNILQGNYDPSDYESSTQISDPDEIAAYINSNINADSLHQFLEILTSFGTRNSGSDTLSLTTGIGAARNWIHSKFQSFSERNENRLIPDFLQFDRTFNGMSRHKNVLAILPGMDPSKGVIIVEGHMDSRCEVNDDVTCPAPGADDNASGTSLVIELARVMSGLNLDRTMVFMTTTGEEQGLVGADAMSRYCVDLDVDIKAVFNNDVVGGIHCGETSSKPSCPGEGDVDSTQLRIFSAGNLNSSSKNLARYTKLQYQEMLQPIVSVPMTISIMSPEDRVGRGGDHIPFREDGFPAIRFTCANEHGDAGVDDPNYHDHQHTSDDILGEDTDGDMIIDSFYVDFNYLARNATVNAIAATMVSISPEPPEVSLEVSENIATVTVIDDNDILNYRVGVRSATMDFDTLISLVGTKEISIPMAEGNAFYFFSACIVDDRGIESCFSNEEFVLTSSTEELEAEERKNIVLLANRPNPFDYATTIGCHVFEKVDHQLAEIVISDTQGRIISRTPVEMKVGFNEWLYRHDNGHQGAHYYSLVIDGYIIETKTMIINY